MNYIEQIAVFPKNIFAFYTNKAYFNKFNIQDINTLIPGYAGNVSLVFQKQSHSANIVKVTSQNMVPEFQNTDGLITNLKEHLLLVYTADCTPILLYDKKTESIAAVHAGWKGTAQNIITKAIGRMKAEYDTNPADIIAYLGPCISQKNYEVGNDVFKAFESLPIDNSAIFKHAQTKNKYYCDVQKANHLLMLNAGLKEANIHRSEKCTYDQSETLFSARRDGIKTGRIISGILLF